VIYDFNDQIVTPFNEIHDWEPGTTGNHGHQARGEGRHQEAAQQFALSAAGPRPSRQDRGRQRRRPAA